MNTSLLYALYSPTMSSVSRSVSKSSSAASRGVVHGSSAASNSSKQSSAASYAAIKGKLTSQDPAFIQVQGKLRKLAEFKNLSGDELNDKVKELTDPEKILLIFSHLIQHQLVDQVEALSLDKAEPIDHGNVQELRAAKNQEISRHVEVANIPLKIKVTELENLPSIICPIGNFLCTDYGAKHVALIVGDVILEWGRENVVIPRILEEGEEALPDNETYYQDITKHCPHNVKADRKAPPSDSPLKTAEEEFEHLFRLTSEKKPIFEELAVVISLYNTKRYYNAVSRNCQGFVRDALKALGIEDRPPSPQPNEHMQTMQQKKRDGIPSSFARHEDLDAYIMKQSQRWFDELDSDSLEFLQLAYMEFHGDIACHVPTCKASILADTLQQRL